MLSSVTMLHALCLCLSMPVLLLHLLLYLLLLVYRGWPGGHI